MLLADSLLPQQRSAQRDVDLRRRYLRPPTLIPASNLRSGEKHPAWRQQASRDGLEGQWSGLLKNHRHCTCDLLGLIWCVQESFENVLWRRRTRYRLCLASSCLTDNTLRSCKDSISLIPRYKHCLNSISDSYKHLNTWWKRQGSTHQIYWWRGGGC